MATQRRVPESLQDAIVRLDVDIKSAIDDLHGAEIQDQLQLNQSVSKIRNLIREMDDKIGLLETSIGKVKKSEERRELERVVRAQRASGERNQGWLRKETQRVLSGLSEGAREALLGDEEDAAPKLRGVAGSMVDDAARTTAGLGSLLSRMGEQVDASSAALTTLLTSSSLLKETEDEFATMGAAIASSGKLLCKWERREITDKALFVLALLLFYVTALYILRKRLGALWIFS